MTAAAAAADSLVTSDQQSQQKCKSGHFHASKVAFLHVFAFNLSIAC